jgi:hypothetical protein
MGTRIAQLAGGSSARPALATAAAAAGGAGE